jgi:uncharacterized protein
MRYDRFPSHMHKDLKFYVYIYRDPRNREIFYVGKGQGNRAFSHLVDSSERRKTQRIKAILDAGFEPEIEILIHGLSDEQAALKVEAAVIDLFGLKLLTNDVRGFESRASGVMTLDQIISRYNAAPAKLDDPVCLIRINQLFRYGMSAQELYDVTRGIWRIAPARHNPSYALAIYDRVVQEVYAIAAWFKAGSTYSGRSDLADRLRGKDAARWEFVGTIAPEQVRRKYRYKDVSKYVRPSSQNPVLYVNC